MSQAVPAIVTAGDRHAAKAIHGESKVYLEIEGRPLVDHVVSTLQRVPEVSEVWVVGDAQRLGDLFGADDFAAALRKPLIVVPQFRNLYENAWETYRRALPGAGPEGRDPEGTDLDQRVLYLSADLPFAIAQEISHFIRAGLELDTDYVLGLSTEEAMSAFYPERRGAPGIRMAYFNLREGRFRQNNLHLVKPARVENRFYIEEMYEHRFQKQFGQIAKLALRLLRSQQGGFGILWYFLLLQLAAISDRIGLRPLADLVRQSVPLATADWAVSTLLGAKCRFLIVPFAGCAVDIDNDDDFDAARARFSDWRKAQLARVEATAGPLPLPPPEGPATISVFPDRDAT